jgi:hypothetical protein
MSPEGHVVGVGGTFGCVEVVTFDVVVDDVVVAGNTTEVWWLW